MIGQKGSGSSIFGLGVVLSLCLGLSIGVPGIIIGIIMTIALMAYSDMVYHEDADVIKHDLKKDTAKLKGITYYCKTYDEAKDKILIYEIEKAAIGIARKKRLQKPNGECYWYAAMRYINGCNIINDSAYDFPKVLKDKGIKWCYYREIRLMSKGGEFLSKPFGKILVFGADKYNFYTINIPNIIYEYNYRDYKYWLDKNGFTREYLLTTKISDPRYKKEDAIR